MINEEMQGQAGQANMEQPVEEGQANMQSVPANEQAVDQVEGDLVNQDVEAELGPAQRAQLDAYEDNATIAVFSEESQPAILQALQKGEEPVKGLAETAFFVHKQLESSLSGQGEKMTEITMALGAAHLVSELVVLAEAANLYTLTPEQRLEAYRQAIMKYFEAGLKDGSIDPVELQKSMEPLMNKDQREFGMQHMEQSGISKTAPPSGGGGAGMGQQPQPEGQQDQGILGRG